jgi:hypothetical protein
MVFTIFGCLFVKIFKVFLKIFLIASMKTLLNSKPFLKKLFKKVVPGGLQKALITMALKLVSKAGYEIYVHCFKLNGIQAEKDKYRQKYVKFYFFQKVGKCTVF